MVELTIIIIAVVSGIATYLTANGLKKGAVLASALVTLVSGIILPHLFPATGGTLAVVAACGSYAGMISADNIQRLWEMAAVSLITGILFIAANNAYVGVGGRLGTIAAISCFAWLGLKRVFLIETGLRDSQQPYDIRIAKGNKVA